MRRMHWKKNIFTFCCAFYYYQCSPPVAEYRNTHWQEYSSFDSLHSRPGFGHLRKEWIACCTTTRRLPYWVNGLFYPSWKSCTKLQFENMALAHPKIARQGEIIPRKGFERRKKLTKWTAWTITSVFIGTFRGSNPGPLEIVMWCVCTGTEFITGPSLRDRDCGNEFAGPKSLPSAHGHLQLIGSSVADCQALT